jgi:RHS repeat-associated protein
VDGLGRVVTVVENGICNATTSHGYDILGNLTSVNHGNYGTTPCTTLPAALIESRTFVYNSLSRLVSATNPESGTTCYGLVSGGVCTASYDGNGNLLNRTDARGAVATMTYDTVNRLTGKSYSGAASAPSVGYSYVSGKDFLSSVTSSAASYSYSNFDAYGRPGAGTQTVGSQSWTFPSVVWTPQGQVASLTYPSGRVVTTSFDLAGRIAGVAGSLSGTGTSYVSTPAVASQAYAAQGGLLQWTGGDQITRSMGYNARLQTTSVGTSPNLVTLGLNWAANGNLTSQTVTRPSLSITTQSYGYDGVNRLNTAVETNSSGQLWNQSYVYDNVGNRGVMGSVVNTNSSYTPAATSSTSIPFNNANQWTGVDTPAGYDAAGNTTRVRTQTMGYDSESRMTSWADSAVSGSGVTLTYDGDGRRIAKTSGTGTTTYVYDPAGNLAVEVGGSSATGASTAYLTADHLGSVRLVTNASGACVGAHDYLPFGEEIPGSWGRGAVPCYAQTDTTWKFGGQERDAENGYDNFLARHLSGSFGRFFSVDPGNAGASVGDPQSWNGYSYGANSPLVNTDPSGMDAISQVGGCFYLTTWQGSEDRGYTSSTSKLGCLPGLNRASEQAQQALDATRRWISQTRLPCILGMAGQGGAAGAAAGGTVGLVGLVTGPGEAVIEPGSVMVGSVIGATAGAVRSINSCTTPGGPAFSTGSGGGGGGSPLQPFKDLLRRLGSADRETRVEAIRRVLDQIQATNPTWRVTLDEEINGIHIFGGAMGEAIVIDEEGSVYRGTVDAAMRGELGRLQLR